MEDSNATTRCLNILRSLDVGFISLDPEVIMNLLRDTSLCVPDAVIDVMAVVVNTVARVCGGRQVRAMTMSDAEQLLSNECGAYQDNRGSVVL